MIPDMSPLVWATVPFSGMSGEDNTGSTKKGGRAETYILFRWQVVCFGGLLKCNLDVVISVFRLTFLLYFFNLQIKDSLSSNQD